MDVGLLNRCGNTACIPAKKPMKVENRKLTELGTPRAWAIERGNRVGFNEEKREKVKEKGSNEVRTHVDGRSLLKCYKGGAAHGTE